MESLPIDNFKQIENAVSTSPDKKKEHVIPSGCEGFVIMWRTCLISSCHVFRKPRHDIGHLLKCNLRASSCLLAHFLKRLGWRIGQLFTTVDFVKTNFRCSHFGVPNIGFVHLISKEFSVEEVYFTGSALIVYKCSYIRPAAF